MRVQVWLSSCGALGCGTTKGSLLLLFALALGLVFYPFLGDTERVLQIHTLDWIYSVLHPWFHNWVALYVPVLQAQRGLPDAQIPHSSAVAWQGSQATDFADCFGSCVTLGCLPTLQTPQLCQDGQSLGCQRALL